MLEYKSLLYLRVKLVLMVPKQYIAVVYIVVLEML